MLWVIVRLDRDGRLAVQRPARVARDLHAGPRSSLLVGGALVGLAMGFVIRKIEAFCRPNFARLLPRCARGLCAALATTELRSAAPRCARGLCAALATTELRSAAPRCARGLWAALRASAPELRLPLREQRRDALAEVVRLEACATGTSASARAACADPSRRPRRRAAWSSAPPAAPPSRSRARARARAQHRVRRDGVVREAERRRLRARHDAARSAAARARAAAPPGAAADRSSPCRARGRGARSSTPYFASRFATRRSQTSARPKPPPIAWPCIAAITGISTSSSERKGA